MDPNSEWGVCMPSWVLLAWEEPGVLNSSGGVSGSSSSEVAAAACVCNTEGTDDVGGSDTG